MTTIRALRERMTRELQTDSLSTHTRNEMRTALEELDALLLEIARYEEFFQFAPDAYVITDAGGRVREANRAALELFAAAPGELVDGPLSAYVADEDRGALLERTASLRPGGTSVSWRSRVQPAKGAALAVEFSVRSIPLKTGGAAGLCWLLRP